jgi:Flp pilus assembly protein TadD
MSIFPASRRVHRTHLKLQDRLLRLALPALALSLVAACASTRSSDDSVAQLCAQQDLSKISQRVSLAGGYYALAKNDLACAERLTLDAKSKDAQDAYAWLNLGAIYQRTQRPELAREHYARAMELDGGKSSDKAETAQMATRDQSRGNRPAEIAQFNLQLMTK